jgi:hypothetical protein
MGFSWFWGVLNPYHQWLAGWLAPGQVQTVTESGRYTLAPIESAGGVQALRIPRGDGSAGIRRTSLWVYRRALLGLDALAWQPELIDGMYILLADYPAVGGDTQLLDGSASGWWQDGTWSPNNTRFPLGTALVDPWSGVSIMGTAMDADTLTVEVVIPTATPTPTLTNTPTETPTCRPRRPNGRPPKRCRRPWLDCRTG